MDTQLCFDFDAVPEVPATVAAPSVLVTGATGFIGHHMVQRALDRGFRVWAALRSERGRDELTAMGAEVIVLDYTDIDILRSQLHDFAADNGQWDYIVHCAGATKCLHKEEFYQSNFVLTKNLVDTLAFLKMQPKLFVFISSLGAYGLQPEKEKMPHEAICEDDTPNPTTAYGVSKLCVENYLQDLDHFPYVVFRPTGVYGPREKDYYRLMKSIAHHFDFGIGYKRQDITFLHVDDLAVAVFLAIDKMQEGALKAGSSYFVSDGRGYSSRDFGRIVQRELQVSGVLRIVFPLWMGRLVCAAADAFGKLTKRVTTLNNDKYQILRQRNWLCDIEPLRRDLGFEPQHDLDSGLRATIGWYRDNGWL